MADDALVSCPSTGQCVARVLQPFTPRYKGTGFYSTDHRSGSDEIQELVDRRVAGLHPCSEDVPAHAAVAGGDVERLRRPALEHLDVDPAALHRTVLEDCGDRRADVVRVPSGTTEGPRMRAFSRTSCGGLRLDELGRLVRDDLAGRDPRRVREELLELLLTHPAGHELGRLVGLRRDVEEADGAHDAVVGLDQVIAPEARQ